MTATEVFRILGPRGTLSLLLERAISVNYFYMLMRKLGDLPPELPGKLGGGELRRLEEDEILGLSNVLPSMKSADRREALARIHFYKCGLRNCYGLTVDGQPVYLQWLIHPAENEILARHFPRRFPALSPQQVMLENAFTAPQYRGRGFLPHATAALLQMARKDGFHSAVSYVRADRFEVLNQFIPLGFHIHRIGREYKLAGNIRRKWS